MNSALDDPKAGSSQAGSERSGRETLHVFEGKVSVWPEVRLDQARNFKQQRSIARELPRIFCKKGDQVIDVFEHMGRDEEVVYAQVRSAFKIAETSFDFMVPSGDFTSIRRRIDPLDFPI